MERNILRVDDACPTMDSLKWKILEAVLDECGIKPIVGVIPDNQDIKLRFSKPDRDFWAKVRRWEKKGWHIAMHGYQHTLQSQNPAASLLPINSFAEFGDEDTETQRVKIRHAFRIFKDNGVSPRIWMAPAHFFSEKTLDALKSETDIRIISDGLAFFPYFERGFTWIPQQTWSLQKRVFGIWTICIHPNTMTTLEFERMLDCLRGSKDQFIRNLDSLLEKYGSRPRNSMDSAFYKWFFVKRHLVATLVNVKRRVISKADET